MIEPDAIKLQKKIERLEAELQDVRDKLGALAVRPLPIHEHPRYDERADSVLAHSDRAHALIAELQQALGVQKHKIAKLEQVTENVLHQLEELWTEMRAKKAVR